MRKTKKAENPRKLTEDDLIGDASPINDIKKGTETPLTGLVRYFDKNPTQLASRAFWNLFEWILNEGIPAIKDDEWGRVKYGVHPWEEIEIKDRAEFFQRYIDPVLAKGRQVIESYDQATLQTFQRCQDKADELKAKIRSADQAGEVNRPGRPSKITEEQHTQILELREQGMSQRQIAKEIGVDHKTVSNTLGKNYDNIIVSPQCDDRSITSVQGTSQEYLLRRIKTVKPELLDEIGKDKRFKSVRAAAIEASVVKRSFSIQIREDSTPQQIADRLAKKLTPEQLSELATALASLAQKLLDHNQQLAVALAEAIIDQTQETL
ncbi:MAG: helix-turn-helix domain-containing protein [bacterium]